MTDLEDVALIPGAAVRVVAGQVSAANDDAVALLGENPTGQAAEDLFPGALDGVAVDVARADVVIEVRAGPVHPDGQLLILRDVTKDRRHAEVVNQIADTVMVLDRQGVLRWRSDNSELWTGVPHADVLGTRHLSRLHPEDLPEALRLISHMFEHPGERVEMIARGQSLLEPGTWEQVALRGVAVDGPTLTGVLVEATVLTSGLRPDPLTRTAGASIAELAPVGIVICGASGETVYGNRAAHDLLGPSFDPVMGSSWTDGLDALDREKAVAAVAAAIAGREPDPFVVTLVVEGEPRWLRVIVRAQAPDGQVAHSLMATLEDITDEVNARAQAHRLEILLDNSDDYVASFDAGGALLWANRAVRDLMATHGVDVAGMLQADEALVAEALTALATEGRWTGEVRVQAGPEGEPQILSLIAVADEVAGSGLVSLAIARDITRLKQVEEELRVLATHDHLTGLANRALFSGELERALARREGTSVGVLYADLDGFKQVNDELGHASGDWLLELVADRFHEACRPEDLIARVGGDEFAIMVLDAEPVELVELGRRLLADVTAPIDWLPNLSFGLSIGVATAPCGTGADVSKLLRSADDAMYRAKRSGLGIDVGI